MVITILEAKLDRDRTGDLEHVYREGTASLPAGLVETFLVRSAQDERLYRIITVWSSQEVLEEMRASVEKPKGIQMFEAAGADPELSIFEVVSHSQQGEK